MTVLMIVSFFLLIYSFSVSYVIGQQERFVVKTCEDFTSYGEALAAYNAGDMKLDENKDGIPCDALFKKDNK